MVQNPSVRNSQTARPLQAARLKKVFKTVCLREPGNTADRNQVNSMTTTFKAENYKLKTAFSDAAVYCMAD